MTLNARFVIFAFAATLLLDACGKQEPPPAPAEALALGHYRATLTLPL